MLWRTSAVDRIARGIRAAVVSPPIVGAAYVSGLSAIDAGGDRGRAEAVDAFITDRFPAELSRMRLGVIAVAIALGLVVGLVAEVLLRLRHPSTRLARRSAATRFVESALLVAGLHAALVGWSMADSPQLYVAGWYAAGGLRRTVQVLATDVLHPWGVVLTTLGLAVVYVRPARILDLIADLSAAQRSLRSVFARGARRSIAPVTLLAIAAPSFSDVRASEASRSSTPTTLARTDDGRPLNVLVLSVGALRADRLDPRRAPNLTELAARSTRFDRAYASIPRTAPSWVTLLTGRYGHHHGIRSMFPTAEQRMNDLDALPARFAEAGYATAAVSDHAGDVFGRFQLGFERIDAPSSDLRQVLRRKVLERETALLPVLHSHLGRRMFPAMRELATASDPMLLAGDVEATLRSMKDKPFFATVFFSATQLPYAAPAPYHARYTDRSYRGRFKYLGSPVVGSGAEVAPDDRDIRQIQGLYDGAVASVDDAVGRVLRTLERLDLAERTIIVVTADHGEQIFEHGRGQGNGAHLFGDEGTHVPLVIFDPRVDSAAKGKGSTREGRRVRSVVRDVDLAPTLYELTGVTPPGDLDGRSLAPALRGEALDARLAHAESGAWLTDEVAGLADELRLPYPSLGESTELDPERSQILLREEVEPVTLMARHRMVRDERWKLVYVPTRAGVRYFLFDTDADPAEVHDVAGAHRDEVARLRAELWAWMLQDPRMEQKGGYLVPRGTR